MKNKYDVATSDLEHLRKQLCENTSSMLRVLIERHELYSSLNAHLSTQDISEKNESLLKSIYDPIYEMDNILLEQLDYRLVKGIFSLLKEDFILSFDVTCDSRETAKIAFLGEIGSYSFWAAKSFFDAKIAENQFIGLSSFEAITAAVDNGTADYGILPIENTTSGSVNEAFDALARCESKVIAELALPIQHALVGKPGTKIEEITEIVSHPQALQQCSIYLSKFENAQSSPRISTASAMQEVAIDETNCKCAIGSQDAALAYGLEILDANISNEKENFTRFFVLSRIAKGVPLGIPAKTTLIFSTKKQAGALVDSLLVFKEQNISISKLESRPSKINDDEEVFYIDIDINIKHKAFTIIHDHLAKHVVRLNILGCYPRLLRG